MCILLLLLLLLLPLLLLLLVNLWTDCLIQVGYEVGSGCTRLPDYCMNDLDEKLIPVINSAVSPPSSGQPVILELIFHILHQLPSPST